MANEMQKPVLEGKGATDYERYLRTDDLLSLQTVTEDLSHPDELTFQVVHQSSELLMKGASWELERARVALTEGNYPNCARLMRRADDMLEHPISLLRVLERYLRRKSSAGRGDAPIIQGVEGSRAMGSATIRRARES